MAPSAAMRSTAPLWATLDDRELLARFTWESGTPVELVSAAKGGDPLRFGTVWRAQHRARRTAVGNVKTLLSGWSLNAVLAATNSESADVSPAVATALTAVLKTAANRKPRRASMKPQASWLTQTQPLIKALSQTTAGQKRQPLETLVALELLWTLGDRIAPRYWWPLWRRTLTDVLQLLQPGAISDSDHAAQLILHGELPLLAGLVFRPLSLGSEWLKKGQRYCVKELAARTDTDGTPHAELLPRLPAWLAPLIRLTLWTQQAGQSLWSADQRSLVSDLLEKSVALCRPDGTFAMTNGAGFDAVPMLRHGADLFDWSTTNPSRLCLKSLAEHAAGMKPRSSGAAAISIMPSNQSDWARLAVIRSDWTATATTITIAHHAPLPQLDVTISGQPVLHGPWGIDLRVGSSAIELAEEWACVCWESQPEADYAELQMTGPGKLRVERLILLSREDHFLMLADSVSGAPAGPLAIQTRLPLVPGITGSFDAGLRAGRFESDKAKVRVFPLALPHDTVQSTPHRCTIDQGELVLEQQGLGQGLFAPIIIDFHPNRRRKDSFWRKLTVTEDSRPVANDVAAAYRWKLGTEQWLVYRSLKKPKLPRAALGYHTGNGFAIGRFDKNGDVDPILMVEE
jgi:hypothetical protein